MRLSTKNKLVEQHNEEQLQNTNATDVQIQAVKTTKDINVTESQMKEMK